MENISSEQIGKMNQSRNLYEKVKEFLRPSSLKSNFKIYSTQFLSHLNDVKLRLKNLRQSNYDLGIYHYAQGNYLDTRLRFRIYKMIWKDAPEADYFIARSFIEQGKHAKAIDYLDAYLGSGDNHFKNEAEYSLKVATNNIAGIDLIPELIVKHNKVKSDSIIKKRIEAEVYFSEAQSEMVNQLLSELNKTDKPYGNKALDLGCSIGTMGCLLRDSKAFSNILGIDFCDEFINFVKELKRNNFQVYDEVLNRSVDEYFKHKESKKFNAVVASEIMFTHNNPQALLKGSHKVLSKDGFLALSFLVNEGSDPKLFIRDLEQFSYNLEFIKSLAEADGFECKSEKVLNANKGPKVAILILHKS